MKITPIEIIKSMSGKVCTHSDTYISLNSSSGKMYTGKRCNPYTGPASEAQIAQRQAFKTRAAYASAWLNNNKPTDLTAEVGTRAHDGTDDYQLAEKLKKEMQLSNIRQVVCKYMSTDGTVTLPSSNTDSDSDTDASSASGPFTISLSASPANGGTVTGAGSYEKNATATIKAEATSGYHFNQWSDGNTSATRTLTVTADKSLTAIFVPNSEDGE